MALTTSNLQIHYDFSNSSCYPGSGTTVTNLGSGGSTYNGTIAGSTVAYSSTNGGVLDFSGTSGRVSIPHNNAVTGIPNATDYRTIQMWVKFDDLKSGTVHNGLIGKLTNAGSLYDGYIIRAKNDGAIDITLNDVSEVQSKSSTGQITTGQWYFITVSFSGEFVDNAIKIYKDASQLTISPIKYSRSDWAITVTDALLLGQGYRTSTNTGFTDPLDGQIGAFYMYDRALTAQEVSDNFDATKSRFTSTNVTITETPATASNAHLPEPIITTTTGASIGAEPATASGEISYLLVSGEVNYLDSYRQVTAILTQPTLAFTFNDHTEIVTSISVSALIVNPFSVIAEINVSINAGDFGTATADIGTHDIVVGSSVSYPANESTASAEMIEPFRFGSDDNVEFPAPMTASALMANGVGSVTANYFNLVKQLDPIYYIYDGQRNSPATVNSGNTTFTTTFDSGVITSNAGSPLSLIGNGNAWETNSAASETNHQITIAGTNGINALRTMHKTKNWAYEWWFKPQSYAWQPNLTNITYWFNNGYFGAYGITGTVGSSWTNMTFRIFFAESTEVFTDFTIPKSMLTTFMWHHFVINASETIAGQQQIQLWINGQLIGTNTFTLNITPGQVDATLNSFIFNANTSRPLVFPFYDEIAFYNKTLNNTQIIQHYDFVVGQTPNRTVFADSFDADGLFADPIIYAVDNNNFPATPITASQLFVEPIIDAQTYINITSDILIASVQSVNPVFYGTPDYRKDAEPLTAYAEKGNNSYALNDTYYSYVQTNIAPFRYITFDGPNAYTDYGTDNDYAVIPTVYGGTLTSPAIGINNKSIKTNGTNYITDGVILKESEWDDTWGTGQSTYHSSFWIKRSIDDLSTNGIRVLWNLNGYKDNQHVILYQYQNKLHLNFNNGTGTHIDQATVNNINVFDYERHHIVITFDHTNANNNTVRLYVDAVLVMTVSLGSYTGTTTNYATSQPANSETYNHPRLGVGCLITPFAYTALSSEPVNTILYVDEIHWAQTGLNQIGVTNLYNAMPDKDIVEFNADFFIASNANLPMPAISAGNTRIATALTANTELITPTIATDYEKIIYETPATASALVIMPVVTADNVTNISIAADIFVASAFINEATIIITIAAGIMSATVEITTKQPNVDPYNLLIRFQTLINSNATFGGGGPYVVGDLD